MWLWVWLAVLPNLANKDLVAGELHWERPADKAFKLLLEENSTPQGLMMYTDGSIDIQHSEWGFTVKHGSTTIDENSAV